MNLSAIFCRAMLVVFSTGVLLFATPATVLGGNTSGIESGFVRPNSTQDVHEIASNVIRVINHTERPVRFHFTFSLPQGWDFIGNNQTEFQLAPGDSLFAPIHVIPQKLAKKNEFHCK